MCGYVAIDVNVIACEGQGCSVNFEGVLTLIVQEEYGNHTRRSLSQ